MALPITNLTIMHVRNATGCPSTDLGTLCAKAKVGGKNGYAFEIKEAGFSTTDAFLIEGALPYWNLFSNESPCNWGSHYIGASNPPVLKPLLKEDSENKYRFSLGDFRGYDHSSIAPSLPDMRVSGLIGTTANVKIAANTGSYDWRKVDSVFNSIALYDVTSSIEQRLTDPVSYTPGSTVNFVYNTSIDIGTLGEKKIAIGIGMKTSHDFDLRAFLPGITKGGTLGMATGKITISRDYRFSVQFIAHLVKPGYNVTCTGQSTEQKDLTKWSGDVNNSLQMQQAQPGSLKSISVKITNADGSTRSFVGSTAGAQPSTTYDFKEKPGSPIGFTFIPSQEILAFIGNGFNGIARVTFEYS